jgi:UDP-glucose 4-epimerase
VTATLVTGGAGYIGSHAVLALLDRRREVVVVDNLSTGVREAIPHGVAFHHAEAGDVDLMTRIMLAHDISAVMHFAGSISAPESVADPIKYFANNTSASLAMVQACLAAGVERFVFSSSAAVYGAPQVSPVAETAVTAPISPYGASKLMTERMLFDVAAAHPNFRPLCLRYFNVGGADPRGRAGQRNPAATGLIPLALDALFGVREALDITGEDYPTRDGTGERDYIHVSDLAEVHVAVLDYLECGAPTVLNCGYGRGSTVRELVATLEQVAGRPLPVRSAPRRAGDAASCVSDVGRMRATLGWRPQYDDLEAILGSALAWREQLAGFEKVRTCEAPVVSDSPTTGAA